VRKVNIKRAVHWGPSQKNERGPQELKVCSNENTQKRKLSKDTKKGWERGRAAMSRPSKRKAEKARPGGVKRIKGGSGPAQSVGKVQSGSQNGENANPVDTDDAPGHSLLHERAMPTKGWAGQ